MFSYISREIKSNLKPNPTAGEIADIRTSEDQAFLERSKTELDHLEHLRIDKLAIFEFRKKIGIPAAFIATPICGYVDYLLLLWQSGDDEGFGLTFLVLGALYWWVTQPKRQYVQTYKQKILPKIAALFGNLKYDIDGRIPMDEMTPSKIVPGHDRYRPDDYFTGEYKGIKLEFSEINLQERRHSDKKTSYVTVFKGLAILLNTKHKRFYGHTILEKNHSALVEWFKQKSHNLERAEMVDPEFEQIFDAYTTDQVEARYLIDPVMIERLKGLYTEYNGEQMATAFFDNKMLILISSKHNHFEPPNIYLPAADPASILNMKREVGDILSIIDKLSLYDPEEVRKNTAEKLTKLTN